jgi:hypothetical protein
VPGIGAGQAADTERPRPVAGHLGSASFIVSGESKLERIHPGGSQKAVGRRVGEVTLELEIFLNAEVYRPYAKEPAQDAGSASWDLRIASLF